jgi:hypothetical protein
MSEKKCVKIEHPNLAPGWGCCKCKTYNGDHRVRCKNCHHVPCLPIEVEDRSRDSG